MVVLVVVIVVAASQEHALPPGLAARHVLEGRGPVAGVLGQVHPGDGEDGTDWNRKWNMTVEHEIGKDRTGSTVW